MILFKCQPSSKNSNKPINYFALYVMPCLNYACYTIELNLHLGSRLVIPIVTVYHFYCNSGFLIPRICNIFSMLVPRQDLSIKINQDQLKNYYTSFFSLFQPIQNQMSCSLFMTRRSFFDPKVLLKLT